MIAEKDWKLKFRYGKLQTPYRHYTVIAEGVAGDLAEGFVCRPGNAFVSMKTWAPSTEESSKMVVAVGRQIGFDVTGRIQIYNTEPSQPPEGVPTAYDISFTPIDAPVAN